MSVKNLTAAQSKNAQEIERIEAECGMRLYECYQCGKCSAGCPMAEYMDVMPRQIIRYLQLGLLDEALESEAPWYCSTCSTCSARCPHDVKLAEVMEAVRQTADRRGIRPVGTVDLFTREFLAPVKWFGRSHELSMTAMYNLSSGDLFQNFIHLPKMLVGKKLKIIPESVKNKEQVQRLMENCEKEVSR